VHPSQLDGHARQPVRARGHLGARRQAPRGQRGALRGSRDERHGPRGVAGAPGLTAPGTRPPSRRRYDRRVARTGTESAGEALARLYDLDLVEEPGDIELYRALARRTGGPIIELAVGSGRVAAALVADGHVVVGVDNDPAMLARAGARIAAGHLTLVEGDLAAAPSIASVK